MENKTLEKSTRYLDLSHLFWYFLQQIITKWYLFLIIILAGSIAGTGYAALKNRRQEQVQNTESVSVTEEEFLNIRDTAKLQDALEEQEEYNERSILMNCGILTCAQAVAVYQVDAKDENTSRQGAAIYLNLFDGGELYQRIVEDIGADTDVKYIKEVFETEDLENGLFKVKVVSYSTENAMEMLKSAEQYLQEQKTEFTITLLSEAVSEDIDDSLEEKRQNAQTSLTKLQSEYDSAFNDLTQNGKKYFYLYLTARTEEGYTEGETLKVTETSDIPEIENSLAKKRLIIDTCLGFVLGVCCACGYFLMKYCWAEKLINGEELTKMYKLPILGCFVEENRRKGMSFWFLKKQKKSYNLKEKDQECKEIIARLKLRFGRENKIYLISAANPEAEKFQNVLIEEGKKQELCLLKSGDILQNPSEFMKLTDSDQLLLIEKEGTSKYQEIDKELRLISEAGKKVCGIVIIA